MNANQPVILDGIEMPAPTYGGPGFVEEAMRRQVAAMTSDGSIDERHAGAVALALVAARNADTMGDYGKPSGRAMMLTAITKVFELLPEAVEANESVMDELTRLLQANDPEEAQA